jgi:hypothetical protein
MTNQFPGATKMVLSPAAQTVANAVDCYGGTHWLTSHEVAAIAIRAAVKQTRKRKVLKTLWVTMVKGPVYYLETDLLAIADDLEAQP